MIAPPRVSVPNGAYIGLRGRDGKLLGRGFLNRRSEIAFRLIGGADAPKSARELFRSRLLEALEIRQRILRLPGRTDAFRIVNAEGDRLSGLVVDRYGSTCVASLYSIGYVANAEELEAALLGLEGITRVLFRSDERSQKLEGFRLPPPETGQTEIVHEDGIRFEVDLASVHKTGLFLDQRENRHLIASLAGGRHVLDICTNAGGFALAAARSARSVTAVDIDEVALGQAHRNTRLNGVRIELIHADLYHWLRNRAESATPFDLIVLDPPKLARHRGEVPKALNAYYDMNLLALRVLAPGGLFLSCSCSGSVSEPEFLETLRRAGRDAGRRARILELRGAAPDHPISIDFPEGRYLKAVLMHVL